MRKNSKISGKPGGGGAASDVVTPRGRVPATAHHHDSPLSAESQFYAAVVDEVGQTSLEGHRAPADLVTNSDVLAPFRKKRVKAGESSNVHVKASIALTAPPTTSPTKSDLDALIDQIMLLWRKRMYYVKLSTASINRAKALCRGITGGSKEDGDALYDAVVKGKPHPMAELASDVIEYTRMTVLDPTEIQIKSIEKQIGKLAKGLPGASFVQDTWGASLTYFGAIVGEAGNLSCYPGTRADGTPRRLRDGPGCLNKRFGLAPYEGKSGRNWKVASGGAGRRLTSDEWEALGYVGRRRCVMWQIGNGLIGFLGNGPRPMPGEDIEANIEWTPYQKLFVSELVRLAERDPEAHDKGISPTTGKRSFSKHAAAMAKRVVEKRYLEDLWRAWRRDLNLTMPEDEAEEIRLAA